MGFFMHHYEQINKIILYSLVRLIGPFIRQQVSRYTQ